MMNYFAGALGVGALALGLGRILVPFHSLPQPKRLVGCTVAHFANHDEAHKSDHEVVAHIFYPAAAETNKRLKYFPDRSFSKGMSQFADVPWWLFKPLESMDLPVHVGAPADIKETLPVVIFSHGLGGSRTAYSMMSYQIAAEGYIVVTIEHNDKSGSAAVMPDGRVSLYEKAPKGDWWDVVRPFRLKQLDHRLGELRMVLDRLEELNNGDVKYGTVHMNKEGASILKGHLDMKNVGMIGHSFGGCTTLAAAYKLNDRIKTFFALDSWGLPTPQYAFDKPVPVPFFYLNCDDGMGEKNMDRQRKTNPSHIAYVKGSVHMSFSDFPYFAPLILRAKTSAEETVGISVQIFNAWFRKHVFGTPSKLLDGERGRNLPEKVRVERWEYDEVSPPEQS